MISAISHNEIEICGVRYGIIGGKLERLYRSTAKPSEKSFNEAVMEEYQKRSNPFFPDKGNAQNHQKVSM